MRYKKLLSSGLLALGLTIAAASGAMADQIVAINSSIEAIDGHAAQAENAQNSETASTQETNSSTDNTNNSQNGENTTGTEAKPDPASITPTAAGISIYISKRQSKLTLMQNKQVIGTWDAKLGRQSATGDKVQEGDEITPSGSFYVCTRNDKSKYYLALGLSYPNIEDAERGLSSGLITQEQYQAIVDANKAGVTPPWDTPLGGAIEIHGNQGDRGTAGCIAMTNDVMDILWSYCAVGVPVTIGP